VVVVVGVVAVAVVHADVVEEPLARVGEHCMNSKAKRRGRRADV
jgi:hypothetical protein